MLGGNTHLFEAKSKSKTPHILKEWGNISEMSDDESNKDNKSALVNFQSNDIAYVDYVVV